MGWNFNMNENKKNNEIKEKLVAINRTTKVVKAEDGLVLPPVVVGKFMVQ